MLLSKHPCIAGSRRGETGSTEEGDGSRTEHEAEGEEDEGVGHGAGPVEGVADVDDVGGRRGRDRARGGACTTRNGNANRIELMIAEQVIAVS